MKHSKMKYTYINICTNLNFSFYDVESIEKFSFMKHYFNKLCVTNQIHVS